MQKASGRKDQQELTTEYKAQRGRGSIDCDANAVVYGGEIDGMCQDSGCKAGYIPQGEQQQQNRAGLSQQLLASRCRRQAAPEPKQEACCMQP